MEHLHALFGELHLNKVGVFNVEALGKNQDVYVATVRPTTTESILVTAMSDPSNDIGKVSLLRELPWNVLSVRSYANSKSMEQSARHLATSTFFASVKAQRLAKADFGRTRDALLQRVESFETYATYEEVPNYAAEFNANPPFKIALHASRKDVDLPHHIELIPALRTFNFTLTK